MITLVIADNRPIVRAGLHMLLSAAPDIQIVGEAETGNDIQPLIALLRPRVLLLDLKIPGLLATDIAMWMRTNYPDTVVLVLTAQEQTVYLANLMDAGIVGILSQDVSAERLVEVIRHAAQGEILFNEQQVDRAQEWRKAAGEKWESLSPRQKEVLLLLALGTSRREVATRLKIGSYAVRFHISNILKKLKVKSIMEAVCWLHKYFPNDLRATSSLRWDIPPHIRLIETM
jgi:DNA-binding NarL/FixJ family response regulator